MDRSPVIHTGINTLQQRLDLIADKIQWSVENMQESAQGRPYMLHDLVLEIIRGCPQHGVESEDCCVTRVFWWIKNNIEYRQDPTDHDLYPSAGHTIAAGAEDCDGHSILVCSMLSSIGFRVGARVCSPDNKAWHIYGVVGVHSQSKPTEIVPLDTTQPGSFPGWEPPKPYTNNLYQCDFAHGKASGLGRVRS